MPRGWAWPGAWRAWLPSCGEGPDTPPHARISLLGAACEAAWRVLPLRGEPPMTRFIASELARDHWFDISAARRDLGYAPRMGMARGMEGLVAELRGRPG